MKSFKDMLPNGLRLYIIEHRYIFKEMLKKHKQFLRKKLEKNADKSLEIDDKNKWIKKFNKLTYSFPELIEVGEAFADSEIKILKNIEVKETDVIAICVAKNDIIKIKQFISYHRKLRI